MNNLFTDILLAFAATYFLMPIVIRIAQVKSLYDTFDERKAHINPMPRLGGIAIFAGLILSLLLTTHYLNFQYYIACFFILFIVGVVDDILVLAAWKKTIMQVLVAALLITKAGLVINNLQGFLGIYQISPIASYLFTTVTVFAIINAFNLIDGIDGLAGTLGTISCLSFALFFYVNGDNAYAALGFCMAGTLMAFLAYNFPPAKIFMGDCGSLMIGLVNAILVIHFINMAGGAAVLSVKAAPAIGLAVIAIPVMDSFRVFVVRLYKGQSPFVPDRNHLHHLFLNKGFSHKTITLAIAAISILFTAVAYIAQFNKLNTTLIIGVLAALFFLSVYIIKYYIYKRTKLHVVKNIETTPLYQSTEKTVSTMVTIYKKQEPAVVKEEE